jgi:hypothetical protein
MRAWKEQYPDVFVSVGWRQVETMAEAGIEFGSHTCRHPHLTQLDDEHLREELLDSRTRIMERLGRCDAIAYPFGACTQHVACAAADAGYSFGFSSPYGSAGIGWQRGATRMSIPRIGIEDRDRERRFGLKLTPWGRRLLLSPVKAGMRAAEPRWNRLLGQPSGIEPWSSPQRRGR